jgi:multicomponent Na+:H+ antiporter subunit E
MSGAASGMRPLAFVKRALGYFVVWVVLLGGVSVADALVGAIAALAAARLSLQLRPAGQSSVRFLSLAALVARFLRDSLVAGFDVARRAFTPAMPLRTGFVSYAPVTPPGDERSVFTGLTGLMPGSVPVGTDAAGAVLYHCLDTGQPVAAQLSEYEARLSAALGRSRHTGKAA